MPTEMKLWRIEEDTPKPVDPDTLNLESRLEDWIRDDIGMVNDDLLVIGQQVATEHTGAIDLLALDPDANLVILELKRDMTPREVVAQALDYASYVQKLRTFGHRRKSRQSRAFSMERALMRRSGENSEMNCPNP